MIRIIKVTNRIWGNVNHTQRLSLNVLRFSISAVKGNYMFIIYTSLYIFVLRVNVYLKLKFLDRYYTDKHEWIDVKDNIGTIGISDYAQVTI